MKRNKRPVSEHPATVGMQAEPNWTDITERVRGAKDRETVILKSDSKITGDVTADLKRGVRIRLNDFKLWVPPEQVALFRMSWEVVL